MCNRGAGANDCSGGLLTDSPVLPDSGLVAAIGHVFARPALLAEALTHPGTAGEQPRQKRARRERPPAHYQRLEFLGDRVLGLVVAEWLWRRHPEEPEGDLTRRLSQLVRREALARVALDVGLDRHLVLARSDALSGAARSPRVLADACEAVIAALYLDGGLSVVGAFIERWWAPLIAEIDVPPQEAKVTLQAWAERRGLGLPIYRVVETSGPDHALRFTVAVQVSDLPEANASASSKRAAETEAAALLLERLVSDG
jgi:ribonuclease-3